MRTRDPSPLRYAAAVAVLVGLAPLLSYLLALAGEPSNLWFWRDVLGLL